jgi:hypothetical protein
MSVNTKIEADNQFVCAAYRFASEEIIWVAQIISSLPTKCPDFRHIRDS